MFKNKLSIVTKFTLCRHRFIQFFLIVCATTFLLSANASIVIWPTNLIIENKNNSAILHLENRGEQPVVLQIRAYQWDQVNGQEQLLPQQNVIVSPPMATIASGSQQVVRVINKKQTIAGKELTYRLVLDEIPTQNKGQQGVNIQMRYSLPLFIYGLGLQHNVIEDNVPHYLTWRWIEADGNKWIEFHNQSNNHLQLSNIKLNQKNKDRLSTYVLPHSIIRVKVNKKINKPEKLTMIINGQKKVTLNK